MNNKLQGKDLITIGIYTALYIVAIFVASVANVTPLTFMFYPAISSLLGAVFFIMLATKVQKFGAVIIWGVIVGLLYLVLGMVSSRKIKFPSPAQKQRIIIVSSQIHLFHCAGKNGALFFLCTS